MNAIINTIPSGTGNLELNAEIHGYLEVPSERFSFTVVPTYSVEEGRPDFEVHATGCKDLRKMQAAGVDSFEFRATAGREVVKDALVGGRAQQGFTAKNFQVCDCCSPKRMRAAGRA